MSTLEPKKESIESMRHVVSVASGEVQASKLRQDFNLWSTLGVAFSYIATPLSIGSYLAFSLNAGGSPYFFFGYILVFFFNSLVALSLCEMAGFLPHTSGQIFWTSKVAPKSCARALSYFTGGFTTMAWLFWTAGTILFSVQLLYQFISLMGSTWELQAHEVFLMSLAFLFYAFSINTWGFRAMPMLSKGMLGYINCGSLFVLITILVRANPKPSAKDVFVTIVNESGWSSKGVVFLISLLPGVTAINGFDSAAHMAEELPHPAKQVPQVMICTVLLCGFVGLPMVIAFLFANVKPDNLLTATQPVFQLFYDCYDSKALFIIACLIYLGLFTFACGSMLTTASRVWWSFASRGAVPFPEWQGRVSRKFDLPLNAILVVCAIQVLIALLNFGPDTVLTGLVGSAAICFYVSYTIPIICFLVRGRQNLPTKRYFNLGRFGPVINVVAICWASLISVFLCFPTYLPVTPSLMNYASAVVGVGMTFWVITWVLYARKNYEAPKALYDAVLHGPNMPVVGTPLPTSEVDSPEKYGHDSA